MPSEQPNSVPRELATKLPSRLWSSRLHRSWSLGWKRSGDAVWLRGLAFGWLLAVMAGLGLLAGYAIGPGTQGKPAMAWPQASELPRSTAVWSLMVFAHPKCPCTRASIDELAWIMSRCHDRVECRVLLLQPDGLPPAWSRTDIWESAAAIPGVHVQADRDGRAARIFGAHTSGHALLYDPAGRLRFEGGITLARGHRGDNLGRSRVVSLVSGFGDLAAQRFETIPGAQRAVATKSHFVFGCPLFSLERTTSPDISISYRER